MQPTCCNIIVRYQLAQYRVTYYCARVCYTEFVVLHTAISALLWSLGCFCTKCDISVRPVCTECWGPAQPTDALRHAIQVLLCTYSYARYASHYSWSLCVRCHMLLHACIATKGLVSMCANSIIIVGYKVLRSAFRVSGLDP